MEAGVETASGPKSLGAVIQIDESKMQAHLDEVVRATVEETLNALLDAEADQLCGARKYERTEGRKDTRAGSYDRQLHSKAGEVTLQVPKLRSLPFETAIIERYRRRESSVEEALMEMYLAGVSVRRVEDITQALWGTRVSASTVSDLNQRIYKQIEEWRQQPLVGEFPYVFLDGIWLKRSWGGEVKNVSVLVAIGVAQSGYRQILAVSEGAKEDKASWTAFLRGLKERGLKGGRVVRLRQVPGAGGEPGRFLSRGEVATLRGPLLPQRVDGGAERQGEGSGGHAEGHSCAGRRTGGTGKSAPGGGEAALYEVGQGCGNRGERHRRNLQLLQPAAGTLALPQDQQPAGTADARDTATNASGGRLPRRQLGADAGRRAAEACGRHPMGDQALFTDEQVG